MNHSDEQSLAVLIGFFIGSHISIIFMLFSLRRKIDLVEDEIKKGRQ